MNKNVVINALTKNHLLSSIMGDSFISITIINGKSIITDEAGTKRFNYLDTLNYLTKIKLNKTVEITSNSTDTDIYDSLATGRNLLTLVSMVKEALDASVIPFNKNKIFQIDSNLENNTQLISTIEEKDEIFEKLNLTKEMNLDTFVLESELLLVNLEMILFVEEAISEQF